MLLCCCIIPTAGPIYQCSTNVVPYHACWHAGSQPYVPMHGHDDEAKGGLRRSDCHWIATLPPPCHTGTRVWHAPDHAIPVAYMLVASLPSFPGFVATIACIQGHACHVLISIPRGTWQRTNMDFKTGRNLRLLLIIGRKL